MTRIAKKPDTGGSPGTDLTADDCFKEPFHDLVARLAAPAAIVSLVGESLSVVAANERIDRILDVAATIPGTFPAEFKGCCQADCLDDLESGLRGAHGKQMATEVEISITRNGETNSWRCCFVPIAERESGVGLLLMTAVDITEFRQQDIEDRIQDLRFEAMFESANYGILTCSLEGVIKTTNEALERIFGYSRDELIGKPITMLMPADLRPTHGAYVNEFVNSPDRSRQMRQRTQVKGLRKDGANFFAEVSISKTYTAQGVELSAIVQDETEMWEMIERLNDEATTDFLTGLSNRRAFMRRLHEELARSRRYDRSLTVAALDIDKFKAINDTRGHDVGDKVLQGLAALLRKECRDTDFVGRVGGEEFCLAMPETGAEHGQNGAERIRECIERQSFNSDVPYTASFGVATLEPDESLDKLLKRADDCLYRSKAKGRNCVTVEQGNTSETATVRSTN